MPRSRRNVNARRAIAEVARSRWRPIWPRPCRWTLPAEWKSADTSASRQQPRLGAIAASSERRSSESAMALQREETALVPDAERPVAPDPPGADDTVARHEEREPVVRAECARGAGGARVPGELRQLAVGHHRAPRDR